MHTRCVTFWNAIPIHDQSHRNQKSGLCPLRSQVATDVEKTPVNLGRECRSVITLDCSPLILNRSLCALLKDDVLYTKALARRPPVGKMALTVGL